VSGAAVRLSPRTGWVEEDGTVYVAALPDGPPLVLEGPGALVWWAVLDGGGLDDVVARVADGAGASVELVAPDVAAFLDQLVGAGVLDVDPTATHGH
jgi:hypothetical protein